MAFRNTTLCLAGILLLQPVFMAAQTRPPSSTTQNVPSSSTPLISVGGLSEGPITPGEVVHINVFDAPDLSITTSVSESGDVPFPILGSFHIGGLNSASAASELAQILKDRNLMLDPVITVTVDSLSTGITILGEVHNPGIYAPPGKHQLSDLLATAGGMTTTTGRIIEITNDNNPGKKDFVSWDPTMHNTENFDRPVHAGDRVLVRSCGVIYVGGNVTRAGAYPLCGSRHMTLSEVLALAGGTAPNTKFNKTYLVRTQPDGTKVVEEIDIKKVLTSRVSDPMVQEDDIIFVSPSPLKSILKSAAAFALTLAPSLLYIYQ